MTNASSHDDRAEHLPRGPGSRRWLATKRMAAGTALLGAGVLAAGCGGSGNAGAAGSGSTTSAGGLVAQGFKYTDCMRSHGEPDFPDPTVGAGGGVEFQTSLNHNSPAFQAAAQACQSLIPGGQQGPPVSSQKLAAELKWAQCIRSHGVPGFPDPDSQGAFDSGKFDPTSSAFQSASQDCESLQPTGAVRAVPGPG
jgi:hypothetical protein